MFVRDFARAISFPPLLVPLVANGVALSRCRRGPPHRPPPPPWARACYARTMASPFTVGWQRYLPTDPAHTPQDPLPATRPTQPATVERVGGLHIDHLDAWDRPVFVTRTARGRARTHAASAARWRDYDAATRSRFLRWVVSQRWAKTSPEQRRAVGALLRAAQLSRVPMLSTAGPPGLIVTTRGEVPAEQARPEDMVCQRCGTPDAQPYRPSPLRVRVGIYLCRRHARIPRARYADTAGVSLGLLHSSGKSNVALRNVRAARL